MVRHFFASPEKSCNRNKGFDDSHSQSGPGLNFEVIIVINVRIMSVCHNSYKSCGSRAFEAPGRVRWRAVEHEQRPLAALLWSRAGWNWRGSSPDRIPAGTAECKCSIPLRPEILIRIPLCVTRDVIVRVRKLEAWDLLECFSGRQMTRLERYDVILIQAWSRSQM